MQTLIVVLIVAAAAFYVGRLFYRRFKHKEGCACGCSCCGDSTACGDPAPAGARDPFPDQTDAKQ